MFQVVVEERFYVVGDEDGVLVSEFLAPELSDDRQTENSKTREREFSYFGLVDNRFDQGRSPVSD